MSAVYDTGTISVTNGSTFVLGAGTAWVGVLRAGWLISLPNGEIGVVDSVVSATEIHLLVAYTGTTQSGQDYWAIATGGVASDLVAEIAARNADVQAMLDGPGAGRFENGTAAQPGVSFSADQDTGIRRSATNTLTITTGGVDRASFDADGMIGAAVQSSETDSAATKLMKVGAFGLGSAVPPDISDFTAELRPGFYRYAEATATGAPGEGQTFAGAVFAARPSGNGNVLIAMRQTSNPASQRAFMGTRNALTGTFTWVDLWTSGVVEAVSNANGTYIRMPNGVQICHHEVDAGSILANGTGTRDDPYSTAVFDWTYPAAFDEAPRVCLDAESAGVSFTQRALVANYFTRSATALSAVRAYSLTSSNGARDATVMLTAIGTWS